MVMKSHSCVMIDGSDTHFGDVNKILVVQTFLKTLTQGITNLNVGPHCPIIQASLWNC